MTSNHHKWGPLPLNDVGRIAQNARKCGKDFAQHDLPFLELLAVVKKVPVRVPNLRPLALSVTSVISVANVKDDEMKPGAKHRSLGIYLTAQENP